MFFYYYARSLDAMLYGPGKSQVMFITRENRISFWNHPIYKWIAHVVRAWDLGFGPVASWLSF
jgi:hypothetical protein